MSYHLFSSLRKQLVHEILFVKNVSKPYRDPKKELEKIDFVYKNEPCKLILNGKIILETTRGETDIESFGDLIEGLIRLNHRR